MLTFLRQEFASYDILKDGPKATRMTFQQIADRSGVSFNGITKIYEEYKTDPQFTNRLDKLNQKNNAKGQYGTYVHSLTSRRIRFIQDLIRTRGALTQREIIAEMHKQPNLLHRESSTGRLKPILSKAVSRLMEKAKIKVKQKIKITPIISNDPQSISNRCLYA